MTYKAKNRPTEMSQTGAPKVTAPKQAPTKAEGYDPMFPPGDEQFQKWDPLGAEVFTGPASD